MEDEFVMKIRKSNLLFFVVILVLSSLPLDMINVRAAETTRQSLDIKKTLVEPMIDGNLNEEMWFVNEPLEVQFGEGNFKDSKFGMLWDHTYLYIGVTVEDEQLVFDGEGDWFQQDNISMFFDPSLHQSSPFVENDLQMGLVYQPKSSTPKFYFGAAPNHKNKAENDILRAIETTETGWTAEVAIPWEMLEFDPILSKQLGFEMSVTHRDDKTDAPFSAWSAYNSSSFWNDTSGYGTIVLNEETVNSEENNLILDENFDSYENGQLPDGWTSHINAGGRGFGTVKDGQDGEMVYDGSVSGYSAAALAPVRWDHYMVEADLSFEKVLNSARWASLVVRASDNGLNQYNQMAVRQNGSFEFAYRTPANAWSVPVAGRWKQPLALGVDYTLRIRVVDNNVKEYIKAANDEEFTLLTDARLENSILERGKVGFRADQSKVVFDNLRVTRVTAESIAMDIPSELQSLRGPIGVSYEVKYSDGIQEAVPNKKVKIYSSDESVIRVIGGQLYPLNVGTATVKAIYQNAVVEKEITVTSSSTGVQVTSLEHEEGYILGTSGISIPVNSIFLQSSFNDLTEGQITGDQVTWSSENDALEISEGTITPKQAGIYTLNAAKDAGSTNVLLVVKGAEDEEYVLYEENFNNLSDGSIPEDWTNLNLTTNGQIGVKAGAFEIDGRGDGFNGTGILLPEYLGMFGNYKIEADMTHLAVNDSSRWNSIMYRVQNNSYPYYQMAVRQNAKSANGVEFAERTPANAWNVPEKNGYSEAISADKMYGYTVVTYGKRVQEWINDDLLIDTDLATAYSKGRIGFQAAGSLTKVDNIKVTLQTEELPKIVRPGENFVHVAEPDTSIALAQTVVTEVDSNEDLNRLMKGDLPATAIFDVNRNLEVTDASGNVISDLSTVIEKLDQKVIPAFALTEEATIAPLTQYLKKMKLEDAFVLSDKPELVKKAREAYPIIRGIIGYHVSGEITEEELMNIRRTTNSNLAKIILLPESAASIENISYLQRKLMTVWVKEDSSKESTLVDFHRIITAGPNGIVTNQHESALNALEFYNENTTIVRTPYMFAHRGIPGLAPENTLEGAILAYQKGATHIENDIYLTKDGHIVILHDGTLDRTTNGTGYVENYTLAELKLLLANDQFPAQYPDARIPTLREFFEEFKGKDVDHIVEIKSSNPIIVDKLLELIEEMGVENQVSVISFNDAQLQLLAEKMPGMSIGFLTGGYANETNVNPSLRSTLNVVQKLNSTFNTSYDGLGVNFMEAAKHRGLTFWPWTYRSQDLFINAYLLGTNGLTTDYNHWASAWAASVSPTLTQYQLAVGESKELTAQIETYDRQIKEITPEIIVIDGQDLVTVNGNVVNTQSTGTVHAMLRYTQTIAEGKSYDIYTQPITIQISDKTAPETTVSPIEDRWHNTDVVLTLEASDAESGVAKTEYKVNEGDWLTYNKEIKIDGEGINKVQYRSIDHAGNVEETKSVDVKIDKSEPTLNVSFNPSAITSRNHELIPILALVEANDSLSGVTSFELLSITSNQPENGKGDGNTDQDIQGTEWGTPDTEFLLRAERSGTGDRVYTITYKATDHAGNSFTSSKDIIVKHDNSKK
jgi:glycerophosphoryl diester phosphodiesterase